jgi:hypothetical protein
MIMLIDDEVASVGMLVPLIELTVLCDRQAGNSWHLWPDGVAEDRGEIAQVIPNTDFARLDGGR